jgi:hypothetical protein
MAACTKCGYDEDLDRCEFCGGIEHTGILGNYGGVLKTICCQVNPSRPPKVLPKDRKEVKA